MDREGVAYHEAGHAVASYVLRQGFRGVTIDPARESLSDGLHVLLEARWIEIPQHLRRISFVEGHSMVLLAGPEAELRATGSVAEPEESADRANALFLASQVNAAADEADAYVEWLRRRAANLLFDDVNWPIAERVAKILLDRSSISYRSVRALIAGEPEQPRPRRPRPPRLTIVE